MNLLLLLSAFLTALSGAIGVARPVQAAEAHRRVDRAETAVVAATAIARVPVVRPEQAWAMTVARPVTLAALALVPAAPAYATRRRE